MLRKKSQLMKLAKLLKNKEEELVPQLRSEAARSAYSKSITHAYDRAKNLLDLSTKMHDMYAEEGGDKAKIAVEILGYITDGLNMSLQNVPNSSLRASYLEKLTAHYDSLVVDLAGLNLEEATNVERLSSETAMFRESMREYSNKYRSGSARALSKAYSKGLLQEGTKFPELVRRHQSKLGLGGEFESLAEAQKLEVYNSIIHESGRAEIPAPKFETASAALGVTVLVLQAGVMVWDIFTAEHPIEAALSSSLHTLSDVVGGFVVQVAVEAAVTEALVETGAGVLVVSVAGFMAGAVAGLIFTAVSGMLIDLILDTGGNQAPPVTDLSFHTTKPPDGMALANKIARDPE